MRAFVNRRAPVCAVCSLALLSIMLTGNMGWSQDNQQGVTEGVSVLGRGPVHEAFADPAVERPAETLTAPRQPPAPVEELPPTEKPEGDNVQWIPGYWAWDQDLDDFIWVSGVWRDIPPSREWVPGYWNVAQGGAQWVPGYWIASGQREVQYLPAPPASLEAGPSVEAPGDYYTYVPGCFVYREARYLWRPGFWIAHHPGWCWTPARYAWTPLGYIFVDGHWDYPLNRRGLIFAPVHFQQALVGRPGWRFRPSYVVLESALASAMFVHPSTGHYYFGNYFDPRYERRGFVPWVDFRIGRRVVDPLFAQTRYQHREPERWEKSLRATYAERRTNEAARPAIDLTRQESRRERNALLTPLARVDQNTLKLTPVPESARDEFAKRLRERRDGAEERRRTEVRERTAAKGPAEQPRVVRRTPSEAEAQSPPRRSETPPAPKTPQSSPGVPRANDPGPANPRTSDPRLEPRKSIEPRPQPKSEPPPKTESRPKAEPAPKSEPPRPKAEPRSEPPRPKAEPKSEPPRPKAEPRPQPQPQPKPVPRSEPRPQTAPPPQPKSEPKVEPKPRPEPRALPRPEPRAPEPRSQPKAEPPRVNPPSTTPAGKDRDRKRVD